MLALVKHYGVELVAHAVVLLLCTLQVFVLNRTQEILQQQENTLERAVHKLEQKAGVQVRWHASSQGTAQPAAANDKQRVLATWHQLLATTTRLALPSFC
jgi:hypothetical protein